MLSVICRLCLDQRMIIFIINVCLYALCIINTLQEHKVSASIFAVVSSTNISVPLK